MAAVTASLLGAFSAAGWRHLKFGTKTFRLFFFAEFDVATTDEDWKENFTTFLRRLGQCVSARREGF
jgi:hypothetical protein